MEVATAIGGENIGIGGACDGHRRSGNIFGQSERKRKVRCRPQFLLNVFAGTNDFAAQELLIGRAAIGMITGVAADFIAAPLQNLDLLPGVRRKAVFAFELVVGKFAAV